MRDAREVLHVLQRPFDDDDGAFRCTLYKLAAWLARDLVPPHPGTGDHAMTRALRTASTAMEMATDSESRVHEKQCAGNLLHDRLRVAEDSPTVTGCAEEFGLPGKVTPTSLSLRPRLSFEDWREALQFLGRLHRGMQWWVGDAVNYGEQAFGEKYAAAVDETGYQPGYLMTISWVCRAVEASRRREALSFACHVEVASLEPAEQERWLQLAQEKGWPSKELRQQIQEGKGNRRRRAGGAGRGKVAAQDLGAEWWQLTLELVGSKNRQDVERALAQGLEVYEVESPPLVVAHWAAEALARWANDAKP
jgi:hypothetical protein